MNARQANRISIRNYLNSNGINPVRSNKSSSLYLAPYRTESNPSLKVSHHQNLWVDFGNDNNGGTLIDLVLLLNPGYKVSDAIRAIETSTQSFFSFHQQEITSDLKVDTRQSRIALPVSNSEKPDARIETPKTKIVFGNSKQQDANSNLLTANSSLLLAEPEIALSYTGNPDNLKNQNLKENTGSIKSYYLKDAGNNPAITNYLNERGIQVETATPFCKEIYYQINNRRYFGLANKNKNGWSIRNKYWKGCTVQGYSYYKRVFERLCVFEGIFDLLSFIELKCEGKVSSDFLVLNSLVNIKKSIPILQRYQSIKLYLDHDDAGRKATETMIHQFPNTRDASKFYSSSKDLNEYHLTKVKGKMVKEKGHLKKDNQ